MAKLLSWDEIAETERWESLLVGNGLSQQVWEPFGYRSLFDAACSTDIKSHLEQPDIELFKQFQTENFEEVLRQLRVAIRVARSTGQDATIYEDAYYRIREALAEAVHLVHIPWMSISEDLGVLDRIREALRSYRYVFATGYDLLVYWSVMRKNRAEGFVDYFWNTDDLTVAFDMANTAVWNDKETIVGYPHGALHLVRMTSGGVHKLCNREMSTLLEQFGQPIVPDSAPLVVTEGDSDSKLDSIKSADYLNFVYGELAGLTKPMVIFGQSLGESDAHLVRAIRGYRGRTRAGRDIYDRKRAQRKIAISIRTGDGNADAKMEHYRSLFPEARLLFFDAATHPLRRPELRVETP